MPLVDTKQLDQEQYGIVFSKAVLLAPCGDGLLEFLLEIAWRLVWHGNHFVGKSNSAADSISA